jgi:hypothetical protein
VLEDTSRSLPKRITWLLDNQRRVVALTGNRRRPASRRAVRRRWCRSFRAPWIRGEWVALALENPFPDAACCLTWQQNDVSPALAWLLDYLGDSETLNREWLRSRRLARKAINDGSRGTDHPQRSGVRPGAGELQSTATLHAC